MRLIVLLVAASFAAAPLHAQRVLKNTAEELVLRWDFNEGTGGWLAGFTDYGLYNPVDMQRVAEIRRLPEEVDSTRFGYFVQSFNYSDDIFMFLKRPLPSSLGVKPGMRYSVTVDIEFLSKEPSGCFGVGGSPGDSVTLKAGVTAIEPLPVLVGDFVEINIDKSNQVSGGRDAGVVSDIGNGRPCDNDDQNRPWVALHRVYHHPEIVTSRPNDGGLWLLVGTDSGYEGLTQLYYYSIQVTLRPLGEGTASE